MGLDVALITVSDTRTPETDKSGDYLAQAALDAGHRVATRLLVRDEMYHLRAQAALLIARTDLQVIVLTGGTGFSRRDITPEAVKPLLDRHVPGFGEFFRALSIKEVGTASIQSRAFAGIANNKLVCGLPGSQNACITAWEGILREQLDAAFAPCNFAELLKIAKD
ncbi:MAG: molybdenum cofactor synthesis domain-containing protein [Gammaproteobacteria bacterium]